MQQFNGYEIKEKDRGDLPLWGYTDSWNQSFGITIIMFSLEEPRMVRGGNSSGCHEIKASKLGVTIDDLEEILGKHSKFYFNGDYEIIVEALRAAKDRVAQLSSKPQYQATLVAPAGP